MRGLVVVCLAMTLVVAAASLDPLDPTGKEQDPLDPTGMEQDPLDPTGMEQDPLAPTEMTPDPLDTTEMTPDPLDLTGMKREVKYTDMKHYLTDAVRYDSSFERQNPTFQSQLSN